MTTKELLKRLGYKPDTQKYKNVQYALSRLRLGFKQVQRNKYHYVYAPRLIEGKDWFRSKTGRIKYNPDSFDDIKYHIENNGFKSIKND